MKWRRKRMSTHFKPSLHTFLSPSFSLIYPISSKTPTKIPNQQVKTKSLKGKRKTFLDCICIAAQFLHYNPRNCVNLSQKLCEPSLCILVSFLGQSVA